MKKIIFYFLNLFFICPLLSSDMAAMLALTAFNKYAETTNQRTREIDRRKKRKMLIEKRNKSLQKRRITPKRSPKILKNSKNTNQEKYKKFKDEYYAEDDFESKPQGVAETKNNNQESYNEYDENSDDSAFEIDFFDDALDKDLPDNTEENFENNDDDFE